MSVRVTAFLLLLICGAQTTVAQQSGLSLEEASVDQAPSLANKQNNSPALATMLELLDQVAVLSAGKGFKSIQLGDSFARLLKLWGAPKESEKVGLLRNRLRWRFQLDQFSIIEFVGKVKIETISVYGNRRSVVRTRAGVRFSSKKADIWRLYGHSSEKLKVLYYPNLGIRFTYDRAQEQGAQMKRIDILSPK